MLPEISRRCVSCGAAVRAGARFCPQCGKVVPDADDANASKSEDASSDAAREPERPLQVERPLQPESPREPVTKDVYVAAEAEPQPTRARAVPQTGDAASPYAAPASQQQSQAAGDAAASEDKLGRMARVREGTRARVENTRARVERVRDDALVALEETPDDSGLRFVLVTAFLFALFLLFLFLSVTVLR